MPRARTSSFPSSSSARERAGLGIRIRAGVHSASGYSAHADRNGLARFITRMRFPPREIRLVHGDELARNALASYLTEKTAGRSTVLA